MESQLKVWHSSVQYNTSVTALDRLSGSCYMSFESALSTVGVPSLSNHSLRQQQTSKGKGKPRKMGGCVHATILTNRNKINDSYRTYVNYSEVADTQGHVLDASEVSI